MDIALEYTDPALRDEFENGMVATRAAFSRVPRTWTLNYKGLTGADKTSLDTFVRTTVLGGSVAFNYTFPDASTVLVRFAKGGVPKIQEIGWIGGSVRFAADFKLEEV